MFGFLKKKPKKDLEDRLAEHPETAVAPGTQIHYNPDLIAELEQDHRDLLQLYTETLESFNNKELKKVSEKLERLRIDLQGHLITENVRLYVYLDHIFEGDEINAELIHGFRVEMDRIGRNAMKLLRKYESLQENSELAASFEEDFSQIGKTLGERIKKEEQVLYPLYGPVS